MFTYKSKEVYVMKECCTKPIKHKKLLVGAMTGICAASALIYLRLKPCSKETKKEIMITIQKH